MLESFYSLPEPLQVFILIGWIATSAGAFLITIDMGMKAADDFITVMFVRAPVRAVFWPLFLLAAILHRVPGEFYRIKKDGW